MNTPITIEIIKVFKDRYIIQKHIELNGFTAGFHLTLRIRLINSVLCKLF